MDALFEDWKLNEETFPCQSQWLIQSPKLDIKLQACLQLRRDQWWEISSGDDTPYHKLAHDKLTREGKLPDYNPQEEA